MEDSKPHLDHSIKEEEETQPEPDEVLTMNNSIGRVWSVKVPKHLMERWSTIGRQNVHLATMRVYERDPRTGRQRISLLVPIDPVDPDDPSASVSPKLNPGSYDEYDLEMANVSVENQFVVAQKEKSPGSRARNAILTGIVKHECNLHPRMTDSYLRRMKARALAANQPKRTVKLMDESEAGGLGMMNMMSSGLNTGPSTLSSMIVRLLNSDILRYLLISAQKGTNRKGVKGTFERYARIPRNQLLDMLFALYRERPFWSAKDLRARTEQPEIYLKEVLGEIAELRRFGEFSGMYELKANYRDTVRLFCLLLPKNLSYESFSNLHRFPNSLIRR